MTGATGGPALEPLLDLDEAELAALARRLERAEAALGAVRYGSLFRLGLAEVVLNPDSPLTSGARATGLGGVPVDVEATLRALPAVFAEAGVRQVTVSASPASAPELELVAEELGYEAVEERTVMLLTRPHLLVEGEPGRSTLPLPERHESAAPRVLAEAHGWSTGVETRMHRLLGHRLDDPRHVAVAALERDPGERLVGLATGFLHEQAASDRPPVGRPDAVGQVVDVAVQPGERRRGAGSALCSAVAAALLDRGARTVWLSTEAGSRAERLWSRVGFEPAYDTVTWVLPLH